MDAMSVQRLKGLGEAVALTLNRVHVEPQLGKVTDAFPHRRTTHAELLSEPFSGTELSIGQQLDKAVAQHHRRSLAQHRSAMPLRLLAFSKSAERLRGDTG
jgi:hypothetical protein